MSDGCEICRRIARFNDENPYFVREFSTGYAVLGDVQFYAGYTIFIAKRCVPELHLLPRDERARFLEEMAIVAEAVFRAFSPRKLNYELLGNSVSHLHWHLFPRYEDDANPAWPVWSNEEFLRAQRDRVQATRAILDERRERLRLELNALRESAR